MSLTLPVSPRNVIDGRIDPPVGKEVLTKFGPRDGRPLYELVLSDASEVEQAVAAARQSLKDGRWAQLPHERRREVLLRLADLILKHRDELAMLETLDVGKPIHDTITSDVVRLAATVRFCANAADKVSSEVFGSSKSNLSLQVRRPAGVVGAIVGWNYPLVLAGTKVAPALAMGNSVILKPSELTSLASWRVAELALEAGLPPGVFNVVHGGRAVGVLLARHSDIDLLSFTGSTRTGRELLVASGQSNMKRLILECGGKSPEIVFDDCEALDVIAQGVVDRAFRNQGQVCTASSRVLVQTRTVEPLIERIIALTQKLRVGDPIDPDTRFGPLISEDHRRKVLDYVGIGNREATLAYQSEQCFPHEGGFYASPTVFRDVRPEHTIAQEEIFGPVIAVVAFDNDAEAIEIANSTLYGLSALVWTASPARAMRAAHEINAGIVVVNATDCPAGPVSREILSAEPQGQSGWGVEGGLAGLAAYTRLTNVQLNV